MWVLGFSGSELHTASLLLSTLSDAVLINLFASMSLSEETLPSRERVGRPSHPLYVILPYIDIICVCLSEQSG